MEENQAHIPEGWINVKFKDYIYFQEGPGLTSSLFREVGFPFLNIRCIENGKINKESCQFISSEIANGIYIHFQLEENDLVVSTSGTLGKKAFITNNDLPLLLNTSIIRFKPLDDQKISLAFLNQLLEDYDFLYDLYSQSTGSAQVNVGPTHLKKLNIKIPSSVQEQTLIATILSKVDDAITKTEQLIAKYTRIKTGLMQDLLTKGIDENGNIRSEETHEFKDSALGRIPKEWECEKLISYCQKIQDGTHFSPKTDTNGRYKYVTSKNIRMGYLDLSNLEFINEEAHNKIYKRCSIKFGDVLLTKDGASTGNICLNNLKEEFSLLSSVALIRGKAGVLKNEFIFQFFMEESGQKSLIGQMSGNAIPRITLTKINNTFIKVPSFKEQEVIVQKLKPQDELINEEKIKLTKLQSLKTGLMQDLLSGKVRVNRLIKETASV